MQKSLTAGVIQLLAAGMMLAGNLPAQTPAAAPSPTASQPASPAKTQTGAAAKKAPAAAKGAPAVALKTQKDKESYALGIKIGSDLKRGGVAT